MKPKINHNIITIDCTTDREQLAHLLGKLKPNSHYSYEENDTSFLIDVEGYLKLIFKDGTYQLTLKVKEMCY